MMKEDPSELLHGVLVHESLQLCVYVPTLRKQVRAGSKLTDVPQRLRRAQTKPRWLQPVW